MSAVSQWSRSDFIDKSQELKRRLEHWHLDGREPMHTPPPKDFPWWVRRTFRDRVMQGEHDIDSKPDNSQTIIADSFVNDLTDPCSKHLTTWLFRDFVEHLSHAGEGESAKLLRLKIDRLLDSPMNRAAKCAIGDYIGGHDVDPELLVQFLEAAQALPIDLARAANRNSPSNLAKTEEPNNLAGLSESSVITEQTKAAPVKGDDTSADVDPKASANVKLKIIEIYTGAGLDGRMEKIEEILNSKCCLEDKLAKVDSILPLPRRGSRKLGDMFGVSHTAIQNSDWWQTNCAGQQEGKSEQRKANLQSSTRRTSQN